MQVAEITVHDLEELKELQPDGWPDIMPHYNFYVNSPFCKPIKISLNNRIAGIGSCILHQSTAWLGHIIVHKEFRNRGIGTAVTKVLCERLSKGQFHSISLIATELGEPVYKKLGFKEETKYHFFKNEGIKNLDYETEKITDNGLDYTSEILNIDRLATGEDRHLLLQDHLSEAKVFIRRNKVLGFYMPTLHEGLVVSTDKLAGIELLKLRLQNKSVSILPRENEAAIRFLTENNFKFYQKGTRMSLGQKAGLVPEMLFNRIGGNLG
jgi:GNAT superfamily N-acetyltransferase